MESTTFAKIILYAHYQNYLASASGQIFLDYTSKALEVPEEKKPMSFTEWVVFKEKEVDEALSP